MTLPRTMGTADFPAEGNMTLQANASDPPSNELAVSLRAD